MSQNSRLALAMLFDENPNVASVGSGGALLGGARNVPDRRSLALRASGAVGSRWQPVSALRPFGINRIAAPGSAAGRGRAGRDG